MATRLATGVAGAVLVLVGISAAAAAQEPSGELAPAAGAPDALGPTVVGPLDAEGRLTEHDDPFALPPSTPIDEATRAEQRQAGLLGLLVWGVLAIAGGAWLVLRWRRKPPAQSGPAR